MKNIFTRLTAVLAVTAVAIGIAASAHVDTVMAQPACPPGTTAPCVTETETIDAAGPVAKVPGLIEIKAQIRAGKLSVEMKNANHDPLPIGAVMVTDASGNPVALAGAGLDGCAANIEMPPFGVAKCTATGNFAVGQTYTLHWFGITSDSKRGTVQVINDIVLTVLAGK